MNILDLVRSIFLEPTIFPIYLLLLGALIAIVIGKVQRYRHQDTESVEASKTKDEPVHAETNIRHNKGTIKEIDDLAIVGAELDRVTGDIERYPLFDYEESLEELESYREYVFAKYAYLIFDLDHVKKVAGIEKSKKIEGRKYESGWLEYLSCEHGITEDEIEIVRSRPYDPNEPRLDVTGKICKGDQAILSVLRRSGLKGYEE